MHPEAYAWIARYATNSPNSVLDIGGRDINGSPRPLFPQASPYTVLDIAPGPNVDLVADAATWNPDRTYRTVICAEVFEHTPHWPAILTTAHKALAPGGRLILTMAGPGRPEHSAVDGGPTLHPGEHYANIDPAALHAALRAGGWRDILIDQQHRPADVRAIAYR